jgi:ESS family glutamate:Na+ symporter
LLLVLVALATVLAILQNFAGMAVATMLGASPLLGLICGSVSMTGGHGTALGFAPSLVKAGFPAAASVGAAAATFGLVGGGVIGAPVATWLIRKFFLAKEGVAAVPVPGAKPRPRFVGFFDQVKLLAGYRGDALTHVLVLLACIKAGSWVWYFLQKAGIVFPVFMGALLVGLVVRNVVDQIRPGIFRSEVFDRLGSIMLAIFLAATLASLNLGELASVAGPMVVILAAQVVVTVIFARWITWPATGRNYEAAVIAAGHVGFGLGNTATAVASMDALTSRYGPAPKAYTIVPPTGGFLIDFTNAVVITVFLNFVR